MGTSASELKNRIAQWTKTKSGQESLKNFAAQNGVANFTIRSGGLPDEAAQKFIEVLEQAITSSLSAHAADSISHFGYTIAQQSGDGDCVVTVYFDGDLSRPSLDEVKYGSINDIVLLLNDGISDGHTMRPVHGVWHGQEYWSRTTIVGAFFMEQAQQDFMTKYASQYGVKDIQINK